MKRRHRYGWTVRTALALAALPALLAWGCGGSEPAELRSGTAPLATDPRAGGENGAPLESVYGIDEVERASAVHERPSQPLREGVESPLPGAEGIGSGEPGPSLVTGDPYRDGEELFAARRYLEAATQLSIAARDRPGSWYTQYLLGLALWKSGDLDGAADSLQRSLELKEDFVKTHVNLSRVLNDAGRFDEALATARRAVTLAPHDAIALYLEGRSLANLGRAEEAIEKMEASLRLDPTNADVHNRLGLVRIRQGRFDQAVAHLEKAAEWSPERHYIRNNLGIAYEGVGRLREAEAQFAAGLEIAGESEKLSTNLARVSALPDRTAGIARAGSGNVTGISEHDDGSGGGPGLTDPDDDGSSGVTDPAGENPIATEPDPAPDRSSGGSGEGGDSGTR